MSTKMTEKCPICLDLLQNSIGVAIPCGHCFHQECFDQLKQSYQSVDRETTLRCPVCKRKTKKFHKLYLSFELCKITSIMNIDSSSSSDHGCTSESYCTDETKQLDETLQTVATLTLDKCRLQRSLRELQSLSRDQSDLLISLLPQFKEVESKLSETLREKKEIEEENSELLSEWNDIEIKLEQLKTEKNDLQIRFEESKKELSRSKEKRRNIKTVMKQGVKELKEKNKELSIVKEAMDKALTEKDELQALLDRSIMETMRLKRQVKKMKKISPRKNAKSCVKNRNVTAKLSCSA